MMMLKVLLTYLSLQMTSFQVMLLAALSGLVVARPKSTTPVTILDQEYNMGDHLGEYDLLVQTSDGFVHSVKARLKNGDAKANEITVSGVYSYVGPDGMEYKVTYFADKTGFHAIGRHLPEWIGKNLTEDDVYRVSCAAAATLCSTGFG